MFIGISFFFFALFALSVSSNSASAISCSCESAAGEGGRAVPTRRRSLTCRSSPLHFWPTLPFTMALRWGKDSDLTNLDCVDTMIVW